MPFTRAYKQNEIPTILMNLFKHNSTRFFVRHSTKYPHAVITVFSLMRGCHASGMPTAASIFLEAVVCAPRN